MALLVLTATLKNEVGPAHEVLSASQMLLETRVLPVSTASMTFTQPNVQLATTAAKAKAATTVSEARTVSMQTQT